MVTPVVGGKAFTVTVAVAVQPLLFLYVIILVPPIRPVTNPVLSTIATLVFDDVHASGFGGVPEPVN